MKLAQLATGLALAACSTPLWAADTIIDIAGHPVPVTASGLYDRYRSNPPLAVIAAEAPGIDLSWFKTLPKARAGGMGFASYSPNFYYKNSRITAVFTADLARLRELMPEAVRNVVQPLQVWPGRGLVALTAYAYEYCDNDSYNEFALSIITSKPGASNLGPLTLAGQSMSKQFWGYVLKLPVNTELARVRGVVGYNLPKWLTSIERSETAQAVTYRIGGELTIEAKKLPGLSSEVELVTNSFTNLDRQGRLTTGYAISRQLRHANSSAADAVKLGLGDGNLSAYIKSLKLGRLLRYEYVPEFQAALYAPTLLP
ncbi:acetoacetate decarboxylase (ADC) [Pseudoduganella sp.]|uniref:acetoacetate decarboxylase (ADC) n=1 Tax=Pseudoduganella sp. TaxID=1880898 RepID=UPI0035B1D338